MGVVYQARQAGLNRVVALKMILAGDHACARDRTRFRLEAEAAAGLQHPNVVPIYEVGEHEGKPFFSMELCEGGSLARRLEGPPWRARPAADLIATLADAIGAAHDKGIIHRDLKPANVLLAADGTPRITDFGIAKRLGGDDPEGCAPLTSSLAVLGTPSYMAPEQAEGPSSALGPATDVYSLGAILYHLLTGRPPFQGPTPVETVLALLADEPTPPRSLNPRVSCDLEAVVLKCLEKDPQRRYQSAAELAADLRRYLRREPVQARALGPFDRLAWWARHRPALAATLLVLAVFYTNHLLLLLLGAEGEGGSYHPFVTALTAAWAAGAAGFQWLALRSGRQALVVHGWAALDVLLLTALLWVKDGPASPLVVGYLLLIAVAALRFRTRLVWFVTELSLAAYAALVVEASWLRPTAPAGPPHIPLVFALGMLLMGTIMSLLLRRLKAALSHHTPPRGRPG
jgi:serine/threonine-protein kinase